MPIRSQAWNHNTHHHPALMRLVPPGVDRALDVGSGDGTFAAKLASRCAHVEAIDVDSEQVAATHERCRGLGNVEAYRADFLTVELPDAAFDLVSALATFHHMPFEAAVGKATRILRPGGRLVLLGVWTDAATAQDFLVNFTSTALNVVLQLLRGPDVMTAPQTMPTMSLPDIRSASSSVLPGATIKRRMLWRYTLSWDKPLAD